jgi:hypothetical protein
MDTRRRRHPRPRVDTDAHLRTRGFARVIGPYVAIFTTVIAIRLPETTGLIDEVLASQALVWMLGAMMLAGGLVIIGGHRNWRGPAASTISLFGWFVAVRGFLLIATISTVRSAVETTMLSPGALAAARVLFALLALIGLWLTYVGWFAKPVGTPRVPASRP